MDRKLSDIKKLEILKKQVEARKIQISKGMNKRQLISIVITLAISACIFAYAAIKYNFSGSSQHKFIDVGGFICGGTLYLFVISSIYFIYKICNEITTNILNKYVKIANKIQLISIVITLVILVVILAYIFADSKYRFSDVLYEVIIFMGVYTIICSIICSIIGAIVYVIYKICNAITTRILNKHVKSANKKELISIVIALAILVVTLVCILAYDFISDNDILLIKYFGYMAIGIAIIVSIGYVIGKVCNAINIGINKYVKSASIRELISILSIMLPIITALTVPLYMMLKNDINSAGTGGTLSRDRFVANTIYGAILGDKMDNYQEDYEKTKDDVYVAKIKSRIDSNAVLSVKFSRKAILWPYIAAKYLVRHVIGSMMVRLSYPVFILPKDLNSGIYSWNFERGKAQFGSLSIYSIGFTENDIIQATRINQHPLNDVLPAFLIAEKNNIRVYKEHPKDIQGIRYIIPKNLPSQKHPLIIQYRYDRKNSDPKLWGYGLVGGQSEFTIKTSLSPNFIVEYEINATRIAEHREEDKKIKLDFDKGIIWNKPIAFSRLYGGTEAMTDLYDLIVNTRDVIEIKDRLIDDPDYHQRVKEDPDYANNAELYYTEISADHPELLVEHPEVFEKIVEYNEKFIAYLKTIAIETHNGKEFKDDVTIYRVVGDELKQMQFDLKKEVEITNKDNKEGNK